MAIKMERETVTEASVNILLRVALGNADPGIWTRNLSCHPRPSATEPQLAEDIRMEHFVFVL